MAMLMALSQQVVPSERFSRADNETRSSALGDRDYFLRYRRRLISNQRFFTLILLLLTLSFLPLA